MKIIKAEGMNNFKRLAEEEGLYEKTPPQHIHNRITESMDFLDFFVDMIDLFLPRALSVFQDLLGARRPSTAETIGHCHNPLDQKPPRYPNRAD
jgi:hypothetical protein